MDQFEEESLFGNSNHGVRVAFTDHEEKDRDQIYDNTDIVSACS